MKKTGLLTGLLNQRSIAASKLEEKEPEWETNDWAVEQISIYSLVPSAGNFYSIDDVEDLKDSIEMLGVQQNLIVKKVKGTDSYKVLAGHRRLIACTQLVQEGKGQFEYVPCHIAEVDETLEQILLIHTNSTTRELSSFEKMEQLSRLKVLLKEYKKTHDLPGRVRDLLAETLNVSPTQIQRLEQVDKNLTPEFKEELKTEGISFSAAAELAKLSVDTQQAVYKEHLDRGNTSMQDAKEAQKKEKTQQTEPEEVAEPVNQRLQALLKLKNLLQKELSRVERQDSELTFEYSSILRVKLDELEKEIFEQMGTNIFE